MKQTYQIRTNPARDEKLTDFGKATLVDRYLMPGETFQDMFARVASAYADNQAHAQRIYDYMSNLWFMPSTPVLSNGGTERGLPISCFLNEANDSLSGIVDIWTENVWLAARGGGIGSYWGNLRSIGEQVGRVGKTSGIIPFIKVMDALTLAISQGSLRRGSAAVYLQIEHPEIEEFLEIRRPSGGDPNRKALNLHHGVVISDKFMKAVENDEEWTFVSPHNGEEVRTVSARSLWVRILTARIETGEPYMIFDDAVNKALPEAQKRLGLRVKMSNLCSEITLPTGIDHRGEERTAVCCLSSVNLEYFDEWQNDLCFIEDIMRFLDNVLDDFIARAPDSMAKARYAAIRERSVGLGAMGFHSYLQSKMIPFDSVMAKVWNKKMFEHIDRLASDASVKLAKEKGPCPDAAECLIMERFSNKTAIAPTASISIICGGASPGIEPLAANAFIQKTLSGSFTVQNEYLRTILEERGENTDDVWTSIITNGGSVQHLECLTDEEKEVFRTAFEVDQRYIIEHAADRTPFVDQSQSVNLFLPADINKKDLHMLHYTAWKKGMKSLYYCRSRSIQRAESVVPLPKNGKPMAAIATPVSEENKYDECLACQ